MTTDFYLISFRKMKSGGRFLYGKTSYDHEAGALSFIKPRQVMHITDLQLIDMAFVVVIHEDYLLGHALNAEIKNYSFFDYEVINPSTWHRARSRSSGNCTTKCNSSTAPIRLNTAATLS